MNDSGLGDDESEWMDCTESGTLVDNDGKGNIIAEACNVTSSTKIRIM